MDKEMKLVSLSEIELQEVEWLWYPYIPFGKITIIQGDPGEGKLRSGYGSRRRAQTGAVFPVWKRDRP